MKASPAEQLLLLEVQKTDLAIVRNLHQENSNPAWQKLAVLEGRQDDLRRAIVTGEATLEGYQRDIEKQETEISRVRQRHALQQKRLDEGQVPLRDMSALEHEIGNIDKRIQGLESQVLELMETAEKLETTLGRAQQNVLEIGEDETKTRAAMDAELAVSRQQREGLEAQRDKFRENIPQPVLALYDRLRARLGPVVVIEVRDGTVINSPVELPVTELSQANSFPADNLYVSDETECIVVRTVTRAK